MPSELRRGAIRIGSNYGRLFSTLIIGLVEVPILLRWVGDSAFGLLSLLGPTIGLASIVREILTVSLVRELGSAYHTEQPERFARTYHACYTITATASLLTLALFAAVGFFVFPLLDIDDELRKPALYYLFACAAYTTFRIYFAPTISMLRIREQFFFDALVLVLHRAGYLVSAILLWKSFPGLDTPASVTAYGFSAHSIAIIIVLVTTGLIILRNPSLLPPLRVWRTRGALRDIIGTFGWSVGVNVAINIGERIPLLVINAAYGLIGSAIYGISYRLGAYARMAAFGASSGLEAVATRISHADDVQKRMRTLIQHSTRINAAIAIPMTLFLAILTEPLLYLWVGRAVQQPDVVLPPAVTTARFFVLAFGARGISEAWTWMLYGAGHVRKYAPVLILFSLPLPLLTWIVTKLPLGESAITIPAALYLFVWFVGFLIPIPFIGARATKTTPGDFLIPLIRPMIAAVPLAVTLFAAEAMITDWNLVTLLVVTAASGVVYAPSLWLIVVGREDRARLMSIAKNRLRPRGV